MSRAKSEIDLRRRHLSQNFLKSDSKAIATLIGVADINPGDTVVEIGAGTGVITRRIPNTAKRIIAVEPDPRHAKKLRAELDIPGSKVEVIESSIPAFNGPSGQFIAIGNIPFGQTAEIVDWIVTNRRVSCASIITQLEYARKRTGYSGRWSKRTIESWPFVSWQFVERVSKYDFRPVPRVDAAIMIVARRSEPLVPRARYNQYLALVQTGFRGRGGSLYSSIRERVGAKVAKPAFEKAGVRPDTIVAHVSPAQWLRLFQEIERRQTSHTTNSATRTHHPRRSN